MKMYAKPEFEIMNIDAEDVICASEAVSSTPTTIVDGKNAIALPATEVSIFDY